MKRLTPLEAVATGLAAGVVGTGFMTAWQMLAAKLKSSPQDSAPEPEPPEDPWEAASAPAKVAKRIGEGVFHKPVSPDLIPLLTWKTPPQELALDLSYHLVYGAGVAGAYRLINRR